MTRRMDDAASVDSEASEREAYIRQQIAEFDNSGRGRLPEINDLEWLLSETNRLRAERDALRDQVAQLHRQLDAAAIPRCDNLTLRQEEALAQLAKVRDQVAQLQQAPQNSFQHIPASSKGPGTPTLPVELPESNSATAYAALVAQLRTLSQSWRQEPFLTNRVCADELDALLPPAE